MVFSLLWVMQDLYHQPYEQRIQVYGFGLRFWAVQVASNKTKRIPVKGCGLIV